jgi:hypothetical protein
MGARRGYGAARYQLIYFSLGRGPNPPILRPDLGMRFVSGRVRPLGG